MKEETVIFAIIMLLCLTSVVSTSGVASFYAEPYIPSACGHSENITNIISVSDALWDKRNACGRKYTVWCKPESSSEGIFQPCTSDVAINVYGYDVTVVDYCGQCNGFTMLLSKEVFSALTNTNQGNIQVEYLLQSN
ncbi:EG45-like domain containing protein 2 [Dendrobium catenatum]|uniref:EG45-like domain containing protein 2 n=1 Tax=Dendrobium catenatum TaxID=906689 RepID=UPI00109FC00E|nr:EG45-like domain containing protein 2 [Dendrobium catenatum]